jgi:hypothetical protein
VKIIFINIEKLIIVFVFSNQSFKRYLLSCIAINLTITIINIIRSYKFPTVKKCFFLLPSKNPHYPSPFYQNQIPLCYNQIYLSKSYKFRRNTMLTIRQCSIYMRCYNIGWKWILYRTYKTWIQWIIYRYILPSYCHISFCFTHFF